MHNVVNELKSKFPNKAIDKKKAQNRMKTIRRTFILYYNIFKNGISGFVWNPSIETWKVELEVMQDLIDVGFFC